MPERLRWLVLALVVALSGATAAAEAGGAPQGRARAKARSAGKSKAQKARAPRSPRRPRAAPRSSRRTAREFRRGRQRQRQRARRRHRGRLLDSPAAAASARLDLLSRAKREILVSSFIFTNDRAGRMVMAELRRAARAGTRVKLLVDGNGSSSLPNHVLEHLAAEGVEIGIFNRRRLSQAFRPMELTHRMHDKLLIVDGESVILGGRNVEEGYFGLSKPGYDKYADLDVHVFGPAAGRARSYFGQLWSSRHVHEVRPGSLRVAPRKLARFSRALDRAERMLGRHGFARFRGLWKKTPSTPLKKVRFLHEDPKTLGNPDARIHGQLIELIDSARREVEIQSPYLVPTPELIAAIARARERGATVRFLTNSRKLSKRYDRLVYMAYQSKIEALASAGAEIWEYRGERSLHAKNAVADGRDVFISSHNVDPRSRRLNKEVGVLARSPGLAKRLLAHGRSMRRDALQATRDGRLTPAKRASQGWLGRFFDSHFFGPLARATGLYDQL